MKALVMGLGLHGGGFESAYYLARHGATVSVTDLRDEKTLAPSIERLEAACNNAGKAIGEAACSQAIGQIRYVLGGHDMRDFENADFVIKNPGVRPDSPYLQAARQVETDISIFLNASPARLSAVTGSKGKSSTTTAIHWVLNKARDTARLPGKAWLGGNITISPLSFLDELTSDDDVVLELSSWQLGDLRGRLRASGGPLLKPRAAVITAIMPDHLDRYANMEAYVADKRVIYQGQDENDITVASDDEWGRSFHVESRGRPFAYSDSPPGAGVSGGWLTGEDGPGFARFCNNPPAGINEGETVELVPARLLVPGFHQKRNLLAAALALLGLGLDPETIREGLASFPGIEHRLEFFHEARGLRFYNDSAATIPEAAAATLETLSHDAPVVLVTGGTDKNLDFSPLAKAAAKAKAVVLLDGSGSEKLRRLFDEQGAEYSGPFDSVEKAVRAALDAARAGDRVLLSPGCASFGMFLNEFDRGRKWKEAVLSCT
jgi:UDP-N-acetylmuramoylalanine--D-glutamate ligase